MIDAKNSAYNSKHKPLRTWKVQNQGCDVSTQSSVTGQKQLKKKKFNHFLASR